MSWEARMAARNRARQEKLPDLEAAARIEYRRAEMARLCRTMTLGGVVAWRRGVEKLQIGCACHGPPDCCWDRYTVEVELKRSAHVVARLLSDASQKGTKDG